MELRGVNYTAGERGPDVSYNISPSTKLVPLSGNPYHSIELLRVWGFHQLPPVMGITIMVASESFKLDSLPSNDWPKLT